MIIETKAYAKLNLTLDVLGVREDGYHELKMVMQTVSLCDDLSITLTETPEFSAVCGAAYVPSDGRNLAVRAAALFLEHPAVKPAAEARGLRGAALEITKRIPVSAGLGGGSADAGAALKALNAALDHPLDQAGLLELAAQIGSDVPFCVAGGAQLTEGRGERLTPLPPLPPCTLLIVKPPAPLSTAAMFNWYAEERRAKRGAPRPDTEGMVAALRAADLTGAARRVFNVLEAFASRRVREVAAIHKGLIEAGALGAAMTGTGSAVFGVFEDRAAAGRAAAAFRYATFLADPVL